MLETGVLFCTSSASHPFFSLILAHPFSLPNANRSRFSPWMGSSSGGRSPCSRRWGSWAGPFWSAPTAATFSSAWRRYGAISCCRDCLGRPACFPTWPSSTSSIQPRSVNTPKHRPIELLYCCSGYIIHHTVYGFRVKDRLRFPSSTVPSGGNESRR